MKRTILTGVCLGAAVAMCGAAISDVAVASATAVAGSGWAQAGSNAADSSSNLGEKTLTVATVSTLQYLRSYTAPPGVGGCGGQAAPVIVGGDVTADVNGYLVHFVAATGHVLWQSSSDEAAVVSVAVTDGKVIVGYRDCGEVSEPDGHIAAYDPSTGQELWDVDTVPGGGSDGYLSNIEVSNGYVITEGNSVTPGAVTVHRVSDGSLVWADNTGSCPYGPAVVVDQEVIYTKCVPDPATTGPARMVGHALATGAATWHRAGSWVVQRGDLSSTKGKHLFATNPRGTLVDINPATGKAQGTLTGGASVLAVDAGQAYATCGAIDGNGDYDSLCAYDLSSHQLTWSTAAAGLQDYSGVFGFTPAAAVAGDVLYLNTGFIANAATGDPITVPGAAYVSTSPPPTLIVGDGRLLAPAPGGRLLDLYGLNGE